MAGLGVGTPRRIHTRHRAIFGNGSDRPPNGLHRPRDRRLESPKGRAGKIELPIVGVEHVLHDCKSETRTSASLVEPRTALKHAAAVGSGSIPFPSSSIVTDGPATP